MTARSLLVRQLPCIACTIEECKQPSPTEAHHLNMFGLAGKKRLGDEYQIPLCGWHHRGAQSFGDTGEDMTFYYGPSLARAPKRFRETYGTDQELLALTNDKLRSVA